tara:strand:- start:3021 stop:5729 length:2709 start_codon:yes stop_codon:yes gene_type:complete
MFKALLFVFLILILTSGKPKDALAKEQKFLVNENASIDLSGWDPSLHGEIKLDGRWNFYWKKFIPPQFDLLENNKKMLKVPVPGLWSDFSNLSPSGFGTYVLELKGLKANKKPIGLYLDGLTTSFKIYFVDQNQSTLLASAGVIGETKSTTIPRFESFPAKFNPSSERGYLVIQISSFHYKSGGLFYSLGLNSYEGVLKKDKVRYLRDFFVFGVLLIMAFYHFGLYFQRKEDTGSLYFGLFSLFLFFRLLGVNYSLTIFFREPSLLIFELERKIEFISVFLAPAFFYGFSKSILPNFLGTLGLRIGLIVGGVFSLIGIFAQASFYSLPFIIKTYEALTTLYLFYVTAKCIKAAYLNIGYSRVFLAGLLVIVFGFGHDVLVNEKILEPPYIFSYILCFFILIQSYLLSLKFSEAYNTSQKLKRTLWEEVQSQTGKISRQNQDLTNLLENLEEGFMVIDKNGVVQEGASKVTQTFFNMQTEKKLFSTILGLNQNEKDHFDKWCFHIWQGKMLFKDIVGLGPSFYTKRENQYIKLEYRPIYSNKNKVDKLICIASDVSKVRDLELKADLEKNQSKMMLLVLDRPLHFLDLIDDTREFLDALLYQRKIPLEETLFRLVHTLKARFSNFKIISVSNFIHTFEEYLLKNEKPDREVILKKVSELEKILGVFLKENQQLVKAANLTAKSFTDSQQMRSHEVKKYIYEGLNDFLRNFNERFILKTFSSGLRAYIQSTRELAEQHDKKVNIILEECNIRVDLSKYTGFFSSCIHLFRNAVDHGLEDPKTRKQKNKSETGLITISFSEKEDGIIEMLFKDDGVGIHPAVVRDSVYKMGRRSHEELQKLSDKEALQLIFIQGLSTKEETTGLSGRGIGLDALYDETKNIGGKVEVLSKLDEGTTFIFKIPIII